MTEKYGFSVVAASSVTVRSSTAASSESCWVLENRCTSSMNSTVGGAPERRARRAVSITARTSFTPADSADIATKRRSAAAATRCAMVVLPVPGGPHRMIETIVAAVDQLPQRRARGEQVLLPDQFVQGRRAHPDGQRRIRPGRHEVGTGLGRGVGGVRRGGWVEWEQGVGVHRRKDYRPATHRRPGRSRRR